MSLSFCHFLGTNPFYQNWWACFCCRIIENYFTKSPSIARHAPRSHCGGLPLTALYDQRTRDTNSPNNAASTLVSALVLGWGYFGSGAGNFFFRYAMHWSHLVRFIPAEIYFRSWLKFPCENPGLVSGWSTWVGARQVPRNLLCVRKFPHFMCHTQARCCFEIHYLLVKLLILIWLFHMRLDYEQIFCVFCAKHDGFCFEIYLC